MMTARQSRTMLTTSSGLAKSPTAMTAMCSGRYHLQQYTGKYQRLEAGAGSPPAQHPAYYSQAEGAQAATGDDCGLHGMCAARSPLVEGPYSVCTDAANDGFCTNGQAVSIPVVEGRM
jgi:hypothetical protein